LRLPDVSELVVTCSSLRFLAFIDFAMSSAPASQQQRLWELGSQISTLHKFTNALADYQPQYCNILYKG